jgi:hypothetical protein
MNPIAEGMTGALRAVWWAAAFYALHAWPVAVVVGVPALVRMTAALRGPSSSTTALSGTFEIYSGALRVLLLAVVAAIDTSGAGSWWQNLWPGTWAPMLGTRLASMSGRIGAWVWMGIGAALAILAIVGLVKLLTWPRALAAIFRSLGTRPARAARRAEAIAVGASDLIALPLTSLIFYAAIARAGDCLHP